MGLVHRLVLMSAGPPWRLANRLQVEGRERLPPGGAVLCFNHPTNIDPVHVAMAYRKPLYFLGKKEAFDWFFVGWFIREFGGQIPLDREGGGNADALGEAVQRLRAGDKIALAPEGTKNRRGRLGRGRTGAARMALQAGVPLVPVAVWSPVVGRARVVFGEPLDTTPWHGKQDDHAVCRKVTDDLMGRIADLLGEPYDPATAPDHWADRKARSLSKGPPGE